MCAGTNKLLQIQSKTLEFLQLQIVEKVLVPIMDPSLNDFNFPPGSSADSGVTHAAAKEEVSGTGATKNQSKAKPNKSNFSICKKTTKGVPTNRDGDKVENKQEQLENKQEVIVARQDKVNTGFEERLKKLELNTGSKVLTEIDDRMDKSNNLVVHRVPEPTSNDPKDREAHDDSFIRVLMDTFLDIKGMDTENKVKFIRRLRKKSEGDEPRPILLGLRFTADLELVLDRSWMLGQSKNSTAEQINIVRDLTARQRQREADMVKEACRKNLKRSVEEVEQNMVYKVVGRKGGKREIKVPLRGSEVLDLEGRVTMGQGVGSGLEVSDMARLWQLQQTENPLVNKVQVKDIMQPDLSQMYQSN